MKQNLRTRFSKGKITKFFAVRYGFFRVLKVSKHVSDNNNMQCILDSVDFPDIVKSLKLTGIC